jgi:uncharacterized protein with HEPN domain
VSRGQRGDEFRVADILEAVANIEEFVADHDNLAMKVYRKAVLHEIGVLGEATVNLSEGFKAAHPEVPWREIAGARNKLVHEYWDTAWSVIEAIVAEDLPALKQALSADLEERPTSATVDDFLAAANERLPVAQGEHQKGANDVCGAWMPIAHAYCALPPHDKGHHRSKLS